MTQNDVRHVIIIGGGPAGYTAGLYAARANLTPLVIEGFNWGGQLMITSDVENYPGYTDGVMGPEMMADFRRQAERFGAEFVTDDVTKVDFSQRPLRVWVGDDEYRAQSVIVATGATARQLGLDSEQRLQGRGVSYCATCDAAFFPDKHVVVVGGGDSAMEEATFLTRFAAKVTIVHRRDEFRASQIMLERARANDKIEWITNAVVEEGLGEEIDLIDPTEEELRAKLPREVQEWALELLLAPARHADEPRPTLQSHGDYIFGVFLVAIAVPEEDRVFYQEVDVIVTHHVLLSVSKTPPGEHPYDPRPVRESCRPDDNAGMMFYRLVDDIAEH